MSLLQSDFIFTDAKDNYADQTDSGDHQNQHINTYGGAQIECHCYVRRTKQQRVIAGCQRAPMLQYQLIKRSP
jgi:hypothetical protein